MIATPMISAAAMDLGLRTTLEANADAEKQKQQQQQQVQRTKALISPNSGAYLSLTGNQF